MGQEDIRVERLLKNERLRSLAARPPVLDRNAAVLEDAWRGLLSRLPVDGLAQEVGVAVVAGVLLDLYEVIVGK